ncbi:TetR family transcriptional regulator [Leucobacter sp. 1207-22]|uniref:TetR family transcriptional regulator n=1 Tax=Leucobacter sp. 1207-22 TaxID=2604456 RepID=UPI004064A7C4
MVYLPRDERRVALLDATFRVIRRDGFAAVSARAVADEVGGSPGLVHQHFTSVVELVGHTWRRFVAEELQEFLAATEGEGTDPVGEFFGNHLNAEMKSELWLWADAWAHAMRVPEFGAVFSASIDDLVVALQSRAPELSEVAVRRIVLLAVAFAGMQRISPEQYSVKLVQEILGIPRAE